MKIFVAALTGLLALLPLSHAGANSRDDAHRERLRECSITWTLHEFRWDPIGHPLEFNFYFKATTGTGCEPGEDLDWLQGIGHIDPHNGAEAGNECEDEGPADTLWCTAEDTHSSCPQFGVLEFFMEGTVGESPGSEAGENDTIACSAPE